MQRPLWREQLLRLTETFPDLNLRNQNFMLSSHMTTVRTAN